MVFMYSFCFWFSVRLGSIIIGIFSLIQTLIILILLGVGYDNPNNLKVQISNWISHNKLLIMENILSSIKNKPEKFLIFLIVIFTLYAFFCILLIIGAYMCNTYLTYPYIGSEFIRLFTFTFLFIVTMILIKENNYNLGILICGCIVGSFLLLYFFYLWACIISFVQIVYILEKEDEENFFNPTELSGSLQPGYIRNPVSVIPLGMNNANNYNILSKLDY